MRKLARILLAAACLLSARSAPAADKAVKAWEAKLVIPTYVVGPAERNPMFYSGRAYQGAKGPIYPYPLLDRLSDRKEDRSYRALYLENPYVRICVLPEIGGRIFEAVDKTNGYNFVYRQHVIKPALIGMLGAWISGGVEWNIPHHHRATSFMTVDSSLETNTDGSATIRVGEIELRDRTKWLVGLTLRPDTSVIEVTIRVFNRTPLAHPILCFANVAVHANESYQIFFPPSTELATFHGKNQFAHWPFSSEVFNGQDYTKGVDVSWWKNHLTPTSFFAFDAQEDFLGGYDHGKQAGVAFVADHNIVPGKKLWTWGTGSEGKTWERILTDSDGPYLELMVGSYSDNQPDYSWTEPFETKVVRQFWYPIRGLQGIKNANREAACNLDVSSGKARIAFNSTSARKGVRAVLKTGDRSIFGDAFDIGPGNPYEREITLPAGLGENDLTLVLLDSAGQELIHYRPPEKRNPPLPAPVSPPPPPKEVQTNEELYLAGLRLDQFSNPSLEPLPYYEEALRRDAGDARVNTAIGLVYLKRGMYQQAEAKFRAALARLTRNYTRPKDAEAFYYLGVTLRRQGKSAEAAEAFQRAAWSAAWYAASFYELAEIASQAGDLEKTLDYVQRSMDANSLNIKARSLEAGILRRLGRPDDARRAAADALSLDPLDLWSANELYLIDAKAGDRAASERSLGRVAALLRDSDANALELATDYANCGMWPEAIEVLERETVRRPKASPLLDYALGYYRAQSGHAEAALKAIKTAVSKPPDYVFPFELEFMEILGWAEKQNANDGRAPYYLGNLLFDGQPEQAIAAWERSRLRDASLAVVHRNLGLAYARVRNDVAEAVASLEKAAAIDASDPRYFYELDVLYEAAAVDPGKRLAVLEGHEDTVARHDDALSREISLLVEAGRYDRALELLRGHHFHIWEGGAGIRNLWVEANLLRGRRCLDEKRYMEGLVFFRAATTYPENLELGPPSRGGESAKALFLIARARELSGDRSGARASYINAAAAAGGWSEQSYFKGLALRKIGNESESHGAVRWPSQVRAGEIAVVAGRRLFRKIRGETICPKRAGPASSVGRPWASRLEEGTGSRPRVRAGAGPKPEHRGSTPTDRRDPPGALSCE